MCVRSESVRKRSGSARKTTFVRATNHTSILPFSFQTHHLFVMIFPCLVCLPNYLKNVHIWLADHILAVIEINFVRRCESDVLPWFNNRACGKNWEVWELDNRVNTHNKQIHMKYEYMNIFNFHKDLTISLECRIISFINYVYVVASIFWETYQKERKINWTLFIQINISKKGI